MGANDLAEANDLRGKELAKLLGKGKWDGQGRKIFAALLSKFALAAAGREPGVNLDSLAEAAGKGACLEMGEENLAALADFLCDWSLMAPEAILDPKYQILCNGALAEAGILERLAECDAQLLRRFAENSRNLKSSLREYAQKTGSPLSESFFRRLAVLVPGYAGGRTLALPEAEHRQMAMLADPARIEAFYAEQSKAGLLAKGLPQEPAGPWHCFALCALAMKSASALGRVDFGQLGPAERSGLAAVALSEISRGYWAKGDRDALWSFVKALGAPRIGAAAFETVECSPRNAREFVVCNLRMAKNLDKLADAGGGQEAFMGALKFMLMLAGSRNWGGDAKIGQKELRAAELLETHARAAGPDAEGARQAEAYLCANLWNRELSGEYAFNKACLGNEEALCALLQAAKALGAHMGVKPSQDAPDLAAGLALGGKTARLASMLEQEALEALVRGAPVLSQSSDERKRMRL